jgi:ribosomal protein S24E
VGKTIIKRKEVGFPIVYPSLSLITKYALKAKLKQEDDQEEDEGMNYAKDDF